MSIELCLSVYSSAASRRDIPDKFSLTIDRARGLRGRESVAYNLEDVMRETLFQSGSACASDDRVNIKRLYTMTSGREGRQMLLAAVSRNDEISDTQNTSTFLPL